MLRGQCVFINYSVTWPNSGVFCLPPFSVFVTRGYLNHSQDFRKIFSAYKVELFHGEKRKKKNSKNKRNHWKPCMRCTGLSKIRPNQQTARPEGELTWVRSQPHKGQWNHLEASFPWGSSCLQEALQIPVGPGRFEETRFWLKERELVERLKKCWKLTPKCHISGLIIPSYFFTLSVSLFFFKRLLNSHIQHYFWKLLDVFQDMDGP